MRLAIHPRANSTASKNTVNSLTRRLNSKSATLQWVKITVRFEFGVAPPWPLFRFLFHNRNSITGRPQSGVLFDFVRAVILILSFERLRYSICSNDFGFYFFVDKFVSSSCLIFLHFSRTANRGRGKGKSTTNLVHRLYEKHLFIHKTKIIVFSVKTINRQKHVFCAF